MAYVLGISSYYHDSAAALLRDGEIISAVQEERFSRIKHDARFPAKSITYILKEYKLSLSDIDYIAFYDKPFLKFERILETYIENWPRGFSSFKHSIAIWIKEKLFLKNLLVKELKKVDPGCKLKNDIFFSEHHVSHAASAFFPSPFQESVILTLDGVGEWTTLSVATGKGNKLNIIKEIDFPNSLGLFYSSFTQYLGFKVNSGEHKVMGLAPYGKPIYEKLIFDNLIDLNQDGSFLINQNYFDYSTGLSMINKKFIQLFKNDIRDPGDELTQFHMDIAASIQSVLEKVVLTITNNLYDKFKMDNLCMAGGVALNCVVNGKIKEQSKFKNIWIQPASGDAGGALGCALALWHMEFEKERTPDRKDLMQGGYLGPEFSNEEIKEFFDRVGAEYEFLTNDNLVSKTADSILKNLAVGWFQGRMEFGPRALGNRSILGNPKSDKMQKVLNLKVKFRESFRPFAPSVLKEDSNEWFEMNYESPYMLFVSNVNKNRIINIDYKKDSLFGIERLNVPRSTIPAVTHVDYSARIQTVTKETNSIFYDLIRKLKDVNDCPVVINTSFNVRGEPIVCTPEDAFNCFMGTNIDILVIGNYFLSKANQRPELKKDYKGKYELD
jgi:carbamoyltransferase